MRILISVALFGLWTIAGAWDQVFKTSQCYPVNAYNVDGVLDALVGNRMPLSMSNFVALMEKYEREHNMNNPDRIADSLLARYRKDGIVYDPNQTGGLLYQPLEQEEVNKQDLIYKVLIPSYEVPEDTFEPREECSLHFMMSHSTDTYPHPDVDDFWNDNSRRRRQADTRSSSYALPPGVDPSNHPIENGVILTSYGPVALGTLLAGLASTVSGSEQTIAAIFGDKEVAYMPDEMKAKRLNPFHVATIAGDIGQTALKSAMISTQSKSYLGPSGMFSNNTAAPKLFSLSDGYSGAISYLTRSEIFAGIDALLIQQYLNSASSSSKKLSQILRMYYSDRGLPGFPTYKACNRMEAYNKIRDDVKTQEQALNFMYAFADSDSLARQYVSENRDNFEEIETFFSNALNDAWNTFSSFVGSYNHEDYDTCPLYTNNKVKCENLADLIVVFNREGGVQETEAQREYISILSDMISVSQTRSRLGVINAQNGNWIMPVTNVSNIADLGANFTMDSQQFGSGGSSTDMMTILDTLSLYYFEFYNTTLNYAQNATAHSQVVVWNVPRSNVPDFNDDANLQILRDFRLNYPNVYFLLVGNSINEFVNVLADRDNDFFKVNLLDTQETAQQIADRVCQIPSMFVYPACNTDVPAFENYNEGGHYFEGFISPNYTTYAKIAPQNFKYSYEVTITNQNKNDVKVCASRVSMSVDPTADDDIICDDSGDDLQWQELCTSRNLTLCNPIYLSISGIATGTTNCNVDGCEYPNQIQYKIGHEGLMCGAGSISASFFMLAIVQLIRHFLI